MDIVDIYTLFEVGKAAGKHDFQLLVSKVVDSQQWRISPNNGSLDFTRFRRFDFQVTYYCSNHLKLMLCIGETSLYEIILSIIINISLVYCSGTPKSSLKIYGQCYRMSVCLSVPELRNWQNYCKVGIFSPVVYSLTVSRKCCISLT